MNGKRKCDIYIQWNIIQPWKEILPFPTIRIKLEDMVLSEITIHRRTDFAWFHLYDKCYQVISLWKRFFLILMLFTYVKWISSRDLLCNIVPIVNNILFYTSKFVKMVDIMLTVLTTKNKCMLIYMYIKQRTQEIWGCIAYDCYFDCGDCIMDVCLYPKILSIFSFSYINYTSIKLTHISHLIYIYIH